MVVVISLSTQSGIFWIHTRIIAIKDAKFIRMGGRPTAVKICQWINSTYK
jgi:hypothetical protein